MQSSTLDLQAIPIYTCALLPTCSFLMHAWKNFYTICVKWEAEMTLYYYFHGDNPHFGVIKV